MRKISFKELNDTFVKHNIENNITSQYSDPKPITGVVVITEDTFAQKYSLKSRSYIFSSDNKAFIPEMCGSSIFANSIDGSDMGVRLDCYLKGDKPWKIDYCYIKEEN